MLAVAAVLLLLYVTYWWTHRYLWLHSSNLPGPRWLPFIGNIAWFSNDGVKNFQTLLTLNKMYGSVYRLWIGPKLYFVLSDPKVIREVMSNPRVHDHDAMIDKALRMTFGNGSIAMSGDDWKRRRQLLASAGNPKTALDYVSIFAENATMLEFDLCKIADGTQIDVYNIIGKSTMNAIAEIVLGVGTKSGTNVVQRSFSRCGDLVVRRILRPWLLIDWIYYRSAEGQEAAAFVKAMHDLSEGIIAEKQDEYRRGIARPGLVTSGDKKINSFLDMMLEASESQGCPLSAVDLRDEVITLIMSGAETTAITMSFFRLLVAIHKEEQDQIHQELDDIFAGDQRLVTAEDLDKMVVLERAIKETMRLFSPDHFQPRIMPADISIGHGRILPRYSVAVVWTYTLHRNEEYFKDAQNFCPDRWLTSDQLHPYVYLPFSAGARTCVGRHLAMPLMKCYLSTVLRQLEVSTHLTLDDISNNLFAGVSLGLNPDIGFMVNINQRNSSVKNV